MSGKNIVWILVIIAALGVGWWLWQGSQQPQQNPQSDSQQNTTVPSTQSAGAPSAPTPATVTYDGNSFSPSSVTIAVGGTVAFTSTGGQMWIASNPHPLHNAYDGTTYSQHCASGYGGSAPVDQCSPGTSFTFTFTKAGTWGYHDHMNAGARGSVTVQ